MVEASAVILCNGEFPRARQCLDALENAAYLVCCDGAVAALESWGRRRPDAIVGDLDSIPPLLKQKYSALLHPEAEQETNDLSKAIRFCRRVRPAGEKLLILGAGGRREDHMLGNIAILAQTPDAEMWTDYGRFLTIGRKGTLALPVGTQISLISPAPAMRVSADGLKWPLENRPLPYWWSGTLNETSAPVVTMECSGESRLLVYLPWPHAAGKAPLSEMPRLPWKRVHFCGVGGVGVSGLAHIALDAGIEVSGSDAVDSIYLQRLKQRGAQVHAGEDASLLPPDTELLVYSSAVPPDAPERLQASRLGIPQCRRGEFLARIAPFFRQVVAVSGSHGKTSTTAMMVHILKQCGRNPGYLIGGNLPGWAANGAWGDGSVLVTEVDESDRSQELMLPTLSLVLNVDDDHSWAIGGTAGLEECFRRLARQSHRLLTWDTPDMRRIFSGLPECRFLDADTDSAQMPRTPFPGEHNRHNALMTREALALPPFGISAQEFQQALNSFPGVDRRLSLLVSEDGKFLYEDYAHHPTELAACLQALEERHPGCAITAYFQPHRSERLLRYGDRFAQILSAHCRHVFILSHFMAWETDAPAANPARLAEETNRLRPDSTEFLPGKPASLLPRVLDAWRHAGAGELFVFLGAGDIGALAELAKLALQAKES